MSYTEPEYNQKKLKTKVMIGLLAFLATLTLFFILQYVFSLIL
jgi:hypothetical protein